ncbi:MAG: hypothetical protein ABI556_03580 [Gemmatimonadales bacterium]
MNTARIKLGFDAATLLLVVGGIAFWFMDATLPAADGQTASNRRGATATRSSAAPLNAADANAIVTGDIFSPTRAAPAARYTPNSQGSVDTGEPVPEMMPPAASPPRVYGTMTGPNGAMALIQPDSAGAAGRLYRAGERVGSFRIEKILKSSVVMRGPSGRVEIPVEQREERNQ